MLAVLVKVFSSFFYNRGVFSPIILQPLHSDSSNQMVRNIWSTKSFDKVETVLKFSVSDTVHDVSENLVLVALANEPFFLGEKGSSDKRILFLDVLFKLATIVFNLFQGVVDVRVIEVDQRLAHFIIILLSSYLERLWHQVSLRLELVHLLNDVKLSKTDHLSEQRVMLVNLLEIWAPDIL